MIKSFLKNVPLSLSGVIAGTMGFAMFIVSFIEHYAIKSTQNIAFFLLHFNLFIVASCIIIASLYCFLLITKYIIDKKQFIKDIKNPKTSGSVAIIFLSICIILNAIAWIINHYVSDYSLRSNLLIFPSILLLIVVCIQIIFVFIFLKHIIFKKETIYKEAYGSWFVVLIGLTISSGYSNNFGDHISLYFFQILWLMSFVFFIFVFPWVLYKFLFLGHKDDQDIPSMTIIAGPANILIVGFFTSFDPKRNSIIHNISEKLMFYDTLNLTVTPLNNESFFNTVSPFLIIMAAFSYILYFIIGLKVITLTKYSQFWAPLTFPGIVVASAIFKINNYYFIENSYTYIVLTILMLIIFTTASLITLLVNVKHILLLNKLMKKIKMETYAKKTK
ncbi:hypothetical protein KQ875_01520 [Mycoplasma zalophi]|uniref:C4-dicarboxylate ABC transporter n=1 Tax=Mycoplasma zalophi TaxID=191287 RepID=A0ABS6DPM3_9MOLU|nr:hypothetical protein [Mycoplasma zalophi]MBU4692274.1 hypothetical protein [Mycoplasma zalophi]